MQLLKSQLLEQDKILYCQKENHNLPITIVITEQNYQLQDRLLCDKCWKNIQTGLNIIPLSILLENIKDQNNLFSQNLNMIIYKNLGAIEKLKVSIDYITTNILQIMRDCQEIIKIWNQSLIELDQQNSIYSVQSEIGRYLENRTKFDCLLSQTEKINELNQDYSYKIQVQLTKLMNLNHQEKCQQYLLDIQQMDLQEIVENCAFFESNIKNVLRMKHLCKDHNQEIIYVDSNQDIDIDKRVSCFKCNRRNGDNIEDFIEKWQKYTQESKKSLQEEFQSLSKDVECQDKLLKTIRKEISQVLNSKINQNNQQFQVSYNKKWQCYKELNNQIPLQSLNQSAEKLSLRKINGYFNQVLKSDNIDLIQQIKQIINKFNQNQEKQQNFKSISSELIQHAPKFNNRQIDEQTDNQTCFAIAFNRQDSIMIQGFGSDIKIYLFRDGQLTEIDKFEGHEDNISCLVFSKHSNSFVSGSMDFTIKLWKETSLMKWKSSKPYSEHTDFISCITLSKDEDFLYSGSYDKTIRIWKLDFISNTLSLIQCLEEHKNLVLGLSLNNSENQMVSCEQDLQIILWEKGNNNQWNLKQKIIQSTDDFGYRIQFVSDTQFIWINKGYKGRLCVFELQDGMFVENQNKQIILSEDDYEDKDFFPIVINSKLKVLFVKHKNSIYSFNYEKEGIINQISNFQISNNPEFYGAFTNNGQYIVVDVTNTKYSNQNQNQIVIYKLNYH